MTGNTFNSVEKSAVVRVGNVTLLTQADVDAFGEAMISEIDGLIDESVRPMGKMLSRRWSP